MSNTRKSAGPPPAPIPPADPGNQLLSISPAQMTTAKVPTPDGERLMLTIRTTSTTMTVFLTGGDAKTWAAQLAREAANMSASGLVIANGSL